VSLASDFRFAILCYCFMPYFLLAILIIQTAMPRS
jgi:hypothetical protein